MQSDLFVQELEGIVSRAMRQAAQSLDTAQVPEDVFWYAQQVSLMPASAAHASFLASHACEKSRYHVDKDCAV